MGFNLLTAKSYKLKPNFRGQFMVEAMIALSVMTVSLIGLFALLTSSFALSRNSVNQYIASGLAAEGIELVKNTISKNIISGSPWNMGLNDGDWEMDYNDPALNAYADTRLRFSDNPAQPNFGTYSYDSGGETQFRRKISIDNQLIGLNSDKMVVTSTVAWKDRGGSESDIVLVDEFYNWQ